MKLTISCLLTLQMLHTKFSEDKPSSSWEEDVNAWSTEWSDDLKLYKIGGKVIRISHIVQTERRSVMNTEHDCTKSRMQESRENETIWESPYLLGFEIPISALKKSRQGEKCVYKPRWIERTKNVHVVFVCPNVLWKWACHSVTTNVQ